MLERDGRIMKVKPHRMVNRACELKSMISMFTGYDCIGP